MTKIDLSHGAGGKSFHHLLNEVILPSLGNHNFSLTDGAVLPSPNGRLVMTTDAHVVSPLFFPGGDIGHLAFCGTVNDLAMMGARPLSLTLSMIIEEGFCLQQLKRVLESIGKLSQEYQIPIVAGDTKVVEKGKADELFLSVTGLGVIANNKVELGFEKIQEGYELLVNGPLGDHAIAIMAQREGLQFETTIESDCAPLHQLTESLLAEFPEVAFMRDLTRGGLAAALHEVVDATHLGMQITESALPISAPVHSACEFLGFDPLQLANEGKFLLIVPAAHTQKVLSLLRSHALGSQSQVIGKVTAKSKNPIVSLKTRFGGQRLVAWQHGEQLPRIC